MWDTILIDGVDLATLGVIEDMSGVMATAPLDTEPISIPGRGGAVFVESERSGYAFDVPLVIVGASRGEVTDALEDLATMLDTRSLPVTVTRRLTVGVAETSDQALCVVTSPLQPSYRGANAARVTVTFYNLDGGWTPVTYS